MQRRTFLALAGASGIQIAYGQPAANQPRLVVVMLRGAMDGLSLVAPYTEPSYYQERPVVGSPGTELEFAL